MHDSRRDSPILVFLRAQAFGITYESITNLRYYKLNKVLELMPCSFLSHTIENFVGQINQSVLPESCAERKKCLIFCG